MWFISAFPEIEKIFQNVGPKVRQNLWKIETLMKSAPDPQNLAEQWFGFSQEFAEEVIHKRISWNQKISQNLVPNLGQKWWKIETLMKSASDPQNLTEPFFAFSHDIAMLKNWLKRAFPEMGKISQNLGPN